LPNRDVRRNSGRALQVDEKSSPCRKGDHNHCAALAIVIGQTLRILCGQIETVFYSGFRSGGNQKGYSRSVRMHARSSRTPSTTAVTVRIQVPIAVDCLSMVHQHPQVQAPICATLEIETVLRFVSALWSAPTDHGWRGEGAGGIA